MDETIGPNILFEGDSATLDKKQRLLLNALLTKRYISRDMHPDHWDVLIHNEDILRTQLHNMCLDLRVDRELGVAFKSKIAWYEGERMPTPLRTQRYNKEATIMMVALRRHLFAEKQEGGQQVYVDRQVLLNEVAELRPESDTDVVRNDEASARAVATLVTNDLLIPTDDSERYQISPAVETLMPMSKLKELLAWLKDENTNEEGNDDE